LGAFLLVQGAARVRLGDVPAWTRDAVCLDGTAPTKPITAKFVLWLGWTSINLSRLYLYFNHWEANMRVFVVAACSATLSIAVGASSPASAQEDPKELTNRTHFQCYAATDATDSAKDRRLKLADQFNQEWDQRFGKPVLFCNPIEKKNGRPYDSTKTHLVCYAAIQPPPVSGEVDTDNQFGKGTLKLNGRLSMICVPTLKLAKRNIRIAQPQRRR
jgi:hypothetical protein